MSAARALPRAALAALAGAAAVLSFAPFGLWWLAPLTLAALFRLAEDSSGIMEAGITGMFFGLGLFGAGVWWIFLCLHQYANFPLPSALALSAVFVFVAVPLPRPGRRNRTRPPRRRQTPPPRRPGLRVDINRMAARLRLHRLPLPLIRILPNPRKPLGRLHPGRRRLRNRPRRRTRRRLSGIFVAPSFVRRFGLGNRINPPRPPLRRRNRTKTMDRQKRSRHRLPLAGQCPSRPKVEGG